MVRRLEMHKTLGIEHLFATGMSKRKIARTLGIDRKSVDRHLAGIPSKGASLEKAPIGEAPTGSDEPKGAKALTGSETEHGDQYQPGKPSLRAESSRSQCVRLREQILIKIEQGLTAQRIYQDLVSEHGFTAKYHSVRRFVGNLLESKELPVRRIEVAAGQEMQIDYGQGARCMDHTGKLRKTYVFRLVLSHSRKGYTEAVSRLTTESLIRSLENAFRALGGVPRIVVFDNAPSAVKHADWYDPELNPKIVAFCKHYGFALVPTRPRTPEHKGKVERGVDYVQENALKGMTFESLSLQNQHLFQCKRSPAPVEESAAWSCIAV